MHKDIEVRESIASDVSGLVEQGLRAIDTKECMAMGHKPEEALAMGFEKSEMCYTVLLRGKPIAMFGVVPCGLLSRSGVAWMLGTDETVGKHKRDWAEISKPLVNYFLEHFNYLYNLVSSDNKFSIRWLKWLGFTVEDKTYFEHPEYGGFRLFYIDRR